MSGSATPFLRLSAIVKRFAHREVLRGLNLELSAGISALVGRNGIGKSTLLCIAAGIEPASAGQIEVCGVNLARDPARAKRQLGYVPDRPCVYPFLTGDEFISLIYRLKGIPVDGSHREPLERLSIADQGAVRFGAMSLGVQRKYLLCAAFIGAPRLMLIDEPTNGLDAAARRQLVEMMLERRGEQAFLCASHDRGFIEESRAEVYSMEEEGRVRRRAAAELATLLAGIEA